MNSMRRNRSSLFLMSSFAKAQFDPFCRVSAASRSCPLICRDALNILQRDRYGRKSQGSFEQVAALAEAVTLANKTGTVDKE